MRARARTSAAPLARCTVSSRVSTSGQRGATSTRSSKPITLSARAAAPTLPAWLVLSRMKRVRIGRLSQPAPLGSPDRPLGFDELSPSGRRRHRAPQAGTAVSVPASLVREADQEVAGTELLAGGRRE